jgi:hypothetical protein
MNNVLAELLNLKKYTKTKEEASLDLKIEKTKVMQQAILFSTKRLPLKHPHSILQV